MNEFLRLVPPSVALRHFLEHITDDMRLATETIPTEGALGRVLAQDVLAESPLPSFRRSTVDGFAVRASDTFGASPSLPAYLDLAGEVPMGGVAETPVGPRQAEIVHTGGMIPEGADAVVMVEDTQTPRPGEVEVMKPAAVGQNVLQVGEDVQPGEAVLSTGARLRPQEIGGLMALGVIEVVVSRRPRVGILSTGDEVIPPAETPAPGQVRDVNSFTLGGLVERAGGIPRSYGILPDQRARLLEAARHAHAQSDFVIIAAGSSVSTRDMTADVIQELGAPGVLVHGIAIKPGKPTILARAGRVPVIGLPGNPISALVVAGLFVPPALARLQGVAGPELTPYLTARLTTNMASEAGREDYVAVRLIASPDGWLAEPVFGRSNLIFTLVRAHGLVRIAPEATGVGAGEPVQVRLM
ncbi:MAG: gephyrin-like molybdotransferase Glp [Anaerolineales bacterium]